MIFDAPKLKKSFKVRLQKMKEVVAKCNPEYIEVLEHKICESREQLAEEMDRITGENGEGVMLRDPESLYENRRSDKLLKVKKFDDAEAKVVGHQKGTGRCSAMLGALQMKDANGITFKIGSGFNDA